MVKIAYFWKNCKNICQHKCWDPSQVIGVGPEALASLASGHICLCTCHFNKSHTCHPLKDYWCVALHSFQLLWSPSLLSMHHNFLCVSLNNSWPPFQRLFFPFPSQDADHPQLLSLTYSEVSCDGNTFMPWRGGPAPLWTGVYTMDRLSETRY